MEKLVEILTQIKPGVDFQSSNNIVEEGLLSSMDIMRLITMINNVFEIEIGVEELMPENFSSVDSIFSMIKRIQG